MKQTRLRSLTAFALPAATGAWAATTRVSTPFSGAKANKGTFTHSVNGGRNLLAFP